VSDGTKKRTILRIIAIGDHWQGPPAGAMVNFPVRFFLFSVAILWIAAQAGAWLRQRRPMKEIDREDFLVVQGAILTLLGLIIGFTFSMAITRYDQRKNYEEAEANAIGTEYVRLGLLSAADVAGVRTKLREYLDLRIAFYRTRDDDAIARINADTTVAQDFLWQSVQTAALAQPNVLASLAASGMNDVLNSQGYTQAAWWNRIPASAWTFLLVIAVCCNLMVGYDARNGGPTSGLLFLLPLIVSAAFLLIADIDSPRHGFIAVHPDNLVSLSKSLYP
jgi:hypothetical protein